MKKVLFISVFSIFFFELQAQQIFKDIYPIGDSPSIGYKTNMSPPGIEKILFEANPILRLPLFNNIITKMMNGKPCADALYFSFNPRFRMYSDNSSPVKAPSYKIGLGYQRIIKLSEDENRNIKLLAFMIESGHFSNGQSGCAFDGNKEAGSDDCYDLINSDTNLSEKLNRKNANFSTNFTNFVLSYRLIAVDTDRDSKSGYYFN